MPEATIKFPVANCLSFPLTVGMEVEGGKKKGYFIFDASHLSQAERDELKNAVTMVMDTDPSPSDEPGKLVFYTKSDKYSGDHGDCIDSIQFAGLIEEACNLGPGTKGFPRGSDIVGLFKSNISVALQFKPIKGNVDFPIVESSSTRPLRRVTSTSNNFVR